jgi:uncharacterized membrane protein
MEPAGGKPPVEPRVTTEPPPSDAVGVPGPERTTLHVALGIVASYASPLPPAHELERLEKIQPGSLERLMTLQERVMTMAEGEQTHRHGIENADSHRMDLGQRFAFGGLAALCVNLQ